VKEEKETEDCAPYSLAKALMANIFEVEVVYGFSHSF
jgi:hypothetical protein